MPSRDCAKMTRRAPPETDSVGAANQRRGGPPYEGKRREDFPRTSSCAAFSGRNDTEEPQRFVGKGGHDTSNGIE